MRGVHPRMRDYKDRSPSTCFSPQCNAPCIRDVTHVNKHVTGDLAGDHDYLATGCFLLWTMTRCAVYGCNNNNKCKKLEQFHFYRFPKTKSVLRQWIHACCRPDKLNPVTATVCCRHFKAIHYTLTLPVTLLSDLIEPWKLIRQTSKETSKGMGYPNLKISNCLK